MVSSWRLAFCTTFPKDTTTTAKPIPNDEIDYTNTTQPTSRFSFFSSSTSSSTPKTNTLRCRTASATAPVSLSNSPKLTCKTTSTSSSSKNSPRLTTRFFHRSCPSSPTSPSSFSLLKSTLRLSKPRCGVCLHSVKTGQGTAIFTAECSHQFHFPCVVDLVRKRTPLALLCPVCTATWKELPLLETQKSEMDEFSTKSESEEVLKPVKTSDLKIYNDDEPLMSPTAGRRFNPIPESDYENDDVKSVMGEDSFQGFFTSDDASSSSSHISGNNSIDVKLLPGAAVISSGRGYETVAVLMEVKAPDVQTRGNGKASSSRAPVDLVAVINVGSNSNLQTTKRAMRFLISSLSSNDRLSIVAFSSCSKRLLPLRRMSVDGRRAARRIVDVIVATEQSMSMSAGDAVRKAAKVLEDRRVKNPVNTIIVLSNSSDSSPDKLLTNIDRRIVSVKTTRLSHLNIPIHTFTISNLSGACDQIALFDGAFAKSVSRLLFEPVQDLRVQLGSVHSSDEVRAVYFCAGRTKRLGWGTGLIKLGDFHADEKREILIELRVPVTSSRAHCAISVRSSYTNPSSQQLVTCRDKTLLVPTDHKQSSPSTCQRIERLRCLFITARAVAESKRLTDRNDFSGANHLLTSALALVSQAKSASAGGYVSVVEAELVELKQRRQQAKLQWEKAIGRRSEGVVLTSTSAWRTAERLAKVARMRKSLNRVSDLHGFENARF